MLVRKVEVKRLSRSLISTSNTAFRFIDLGGVLYILIIVIRGVF